MDKETKLYEGKAKIIYGTADPSLIIQYFKDDATAFDALKKGTIVDKGIYNNKISTAIFKLLEKEGIPTHFVRQVNEREMLVRKLNIFPVEVVIRNRIAGSLAKRFGMEEGGELKAPILEFYYKDDALHDPMINEDHIRVFGFATDDEEYIRGVRAVACPLGAHPLPHAIWVVGFSSSLDDGKMARIIEDLRKTSHFISEALRR